MQVLRTLVVDDDREFLNAAAALVRGIPQCDLCGVARSGTEVLWAVARLAPDLVLLDVDLGDMSGFVVATAIRATVPSCSVVMMSLHDSAVFRSYSDTVGAVGFLAKSELFAGLARLVAPLARG